MGKTHSATTKPHKRGSPNTAIQNRVQAGHGAGQGEVSARQGQPAGEKSWQPGRMAPPGPQTSAAPLRQALCLWKEPVGGLVDGDVVGGAFFSGSDPPPGGGQVEVGRRRGGYAEETVGARGT